MVASSVTQLVYSCQMNSTVIGQRWSSDQQLAFDISHLSNFDKEQLLRGGYRGSEVRLRVSKSTFSSLRVIENCHSSLQ